MDEKLIIAGSGGQGIMLIGKLLTQAMMEEGKNVTYLPAYGTEVRGGTANCQVRISDREIYMPIIEEASCVVVLNQPSYDRFLPRVADDGLVLYNSSMVEANNCPENGCVGVPASEIANDLGNPLIANMVILGALNWKKGLLAFGKLESVVRAAIGAKRPELVGINISALQSGCDYLQKGQ